jgi:poly [ADP-ribose] polymerase 1
LAEVAVGKVQPYLSAHYMDRPAKGTHSTMGVGKVTPDPSGTVQLDGVQVPCGRMIDSTSPRSDLVYNEYIVYDTAQVKMKYIVKLKWHFNN